MDRVEEIEAAITALPADDYRRLAEWLTLHDQDRWDEQINQDSASGKLDFLFEEAESEAASGNLLDWPIEA